MDKLLIIADDFTGALDTGIQFTKMGIRAKIVTDYHYDFSQLKEEYALLVVNTDSRPLSAEDAYQRVYELSVHARAAGFDYVYKKTDSGLRGNIGAELQAVMDAYEQKAAYFMPALPNLHRVTVGGVQYVEGIPVRDSVFGKDPFEPVLNSDVSDIIHEQSAVQTKKIPAGACEHVELKEDQSTVYIFDAETDYALYRIADFLKKKTSYKICAGCAGFAAAYEVLLDFQKGNPHYMQETDGLLALCGSVNDITVKQLVYAGEHGFTRDNLKCDQKLDPQYLTSDAGEVYLEQLYKKISQTDRYALDTLDMPGQESVDQYAKRLGLDRSKVRYSIADSLGMIAKRMVERGLNYTISMTGGDTLMGFMRLTDTTELVPICEIGKGAVLSAMRWNGKRIQVISKSGGFGEEDIFVQMYEQIVHYKEQRRGE